MHANPIHLKLQKELHRRLSGSEIEKAFPEKGRIADLFWRDIVFEIQCSPITLEEVQKRIADYRALGYQVVWLLDDRRYNQRRYTHAELFLRTKSCCYFFRAVGSGWVLYDQEEWCEGRLRLRKNSPEPISLAQSSFQSHLPKRIRIANNFFKFYFRWLDRWVLSLSHSRGEGE